METGRQEDVKEAGNCCRGAEELEEGVWKGCELRRAGEGIRGSWLRRMLLHYGEEQLAKD